MANSSFGYVRDFEQNDTALPDVYLVIRIDGKGFHRFSDRHSFEKPNDARALRLMNEAALRVCRSDFGQQGRVFLAFGESDEFSFALHKSCVLFNRRISKLASTCVSLFTSYYVRLWSQHFPHDPLDTDEPGPSFDARLVQYPSEQHIKDYFKWRQVDTHINNLYNTCFWALVQQGQRSTSQAHADLSGTVSAQKNEILFSRFGINYSTLDPLFRRGSIFVLRAPDDSHESDSSRHAEQAVPAATTTPAAELNSKQLKKLRKRHIASATWQLVHEDMLKDKWWLDFWPTLAVPTS